VENGKAVWSAVSDLQRWLASSKYPDYQDEFWQKTIVKWENRSATESKSLGRHPQIIRRCWQHQWVVYRRSTRRWEDGDEEW